MFFPFLSVPSQAAAARVCKKWNGMANDHGLSLHRELLLEPLYRETTVPNFNTTMDAARDEILYKFESEALGDRNTDTTVYIRIIDESETEEAQKIYSLKDA